ncbi:MAG: nickel/cobalt transporter [Acidimicrobiia bacterium]
MRRLLAVLAMGAVVSSPLPAAAHPLGNFTVNQHVGVSATGEGVEIAYVLDLAEVPAARELAALRSEAALERHAAATCERSRGGLGVTVDGRIRSLNTMSAAATTPPGDAGLSTLRVTCTFGMELPSLPATIEIINSNEADRVGWREIVVDSSIEADTALPRTSSSGVLTNYPPDAVAPDITTGAFTATALTERAQDPSPSVGPGRVSAIPAAIGDLFGGGGGFGLVAMLAAFALGATHALAPGHGKTLMAAYLVGRSGRARHAVGLGLATAVSHTIGVAALGVVTLAAAESFPPERVYPVLSLVSGLTITAIGAGLLVKAVMRWRRSQSHHGHDHGHDHDHGHHHHHDHGHDDHGHGHGHGHDDARPISWRAMATLGLAGGMVPSASAVVLLLAAVQFGRPVLGLVLVGLFGLGMSVVLVASGIAVLSARDFAVRMLGSRRQMPWLRPLGGLAVAIGGVVVSTGAIQSF